VQKTNFIIVVVCIAIIGIILTIGGFFVGQHRGYANGTRDAGNRTAELIEQLNGYEQREAERNRRARERDERTAGELERLGEIGTTATAIIARLRAEINILADYFNNSRNYNSCGDNYDSSNGE